MILSRALKLAETVLENVDQQAANIVSQDDDDDEFRDGDDVFHDEDSTTVDDNLKNEVVIDSSDLELDNERINELEQKQKQRQAEQQEKLQELFREEIRKRRDAEEKYVELKERYDKLQEMIVSEEEEMKNYRAQVTKREKDLMEEKSQLASDLAELQNTISERVQDINRLENLMKMKQSESQLKEQELQEYKNRATKIMQQRDKHIEELKKQLTQPQGSDSEIGQEENKADSIDNRLIDALDREDLLMDLERLQAENHEISASLDIMKRQHEAEKTSSSFKLRNMEKALEREKQNVAKLQQILASVKLSSDDIKQKFENEKKELQDELKKRSADMKQLQKKLDTINTQNTEQNDVELRARAMAEKLIEKQSQLDILTSERTALKIELERAKQQIRASAESRPVRGVQEPTRRSRSKGHTTIDIMDHHDVDSTIPVKTSRVFRNLSERGYFAKKLASGMQWIDSISIHSARHLRINPILRVLFVVYIFLMHAWVIYVLVSTVHILPAHHELHHDTPQHLALKQNINDLVNK